MKNQDTSEQQLTLDTVTMLRDMLRSWWRALLVAAMAAMVAYAVATVAYHPQYTATSTLVVSYTESSANVYTDISAANTLAGTFSEVLNSNVMKQKVAQALGEETFSGTIDAQIVEETNLITVTVTANQPQTAWQAARALLQNYPQVTGSIMDNVVVSLLKAPGYPSAPSNSMNRTRVAEIAALIGALVVLALAALFSYLRDTVKNEKDFSRKVDGRLLTTVYYERKYKTPITMLQHRKTSVLLSNPTTSFRFAETYKVLSTKLEYAVRQKGYHTLMVSSVLENEGKSTVSANLALAMAQKGYSVILVDGDMRAPAVHRIFERSAAAKDAVYAAATGKLPLTQVPLVETDFGLRMLLGGKTHVNSTDIIASDGMRRLLLYLQEQADLVIVDVPPMMLLTDAECLAQLVDASLLVVRQNAAWAQDINDTVDTLRSAHADFLGCVFNNVHTGGLLGSTNTGGGYDSYRNYGYGDYNASSNAPTGRL